MGLGFRVSGYQRERSGAKGSGKQRERVSERGKGSGEKRFPDLAVFGPLKGELVASPEVDDRVVRREPHRHLQICKHL